MEARNVFTIAAIATIAIYVVLVAILTRELEHSILTRELEHCEAQLQHVNKVAPPLTPPQQTIWDALEGNAP